MRFTPKKLAEYVAMLVIWLGLVLLFGVLSDNFLSPRTFVTLANRIPALAVIATGMTLVLIIGGIDLSVGSVLGLCGTVLGVAVVTAHLPLWAAILLSLGVGLVAGTVNGLVSVVFGIPSFNVTLGMLEIARGLAYLTTQSQTTYIGSAVEGLSTPVAGLAVSSAFLIAVLVMVAGQVVLSRTVFGRYVVAIGTNEPAVRLAGINPAPVKVKPWCRSCRLWSDWCCWCCSDCRSFFYNCRLWSRRSLACFLFLSRAALNNPKVQSWLPTK